MCDVESNEYVFACQKWKWRFRSELRIRGRPSFLDARFGKLFVLIPFENWFQASLKLTPQQERMILELRGKFVKHLETIWKRRTLLSNQLQVIVIFSISFGKVLFLDVRDVERRRFQKQCQQL